MSLGAGVRAPLADSDPVQTVYSRSPGGDGRYEELGQLRLGQGAWALPTVVEAGYAFDTWYLAASIGYEARFAGYDDRITWSAEVGLNFNRRMAGRMRASGAHSIRTGDVELAQTPSGMGNGVSWAGIALEVEYEFIESSYVGATLEGGIGGLRSQTELASGLRTTVAPIG